MKIPIHSAAIEHSSGTNIYTATTGTGLDALVAAHCRFRWEWAFQHLIGTGTPIPDIPETDHDVIEQYFDDNDSESLVEDCTSVELDLHAVVEVICQVPNVAVFQAEDGAKEHAVTTSKST